VARKSRTIVTPEQFDLIHSALPDGGWRILVELDVDQAAHTSPRAILPVTSATP
jgi:hypothetical protein